MIINYLGIRLNGPKAAGHEVTLNLVVSDTNE
ncbi:alkyl sulfatase C-terminal domain-containing protein, partial [Escherichia coli]